MNQDKDDNFFLEVSYAEAYRDERFDVTTTPCVTIVGNKKGIKYLVDRIADYLESGDCDYDNLNFDIGPDLSGGNIKLDIVCDEECKLQKK